MQTLFLALLYFGSMHASEYPYRELKDPPIHLEESIKVYVSTPPRTGSTLVFNIAQYLFEDEDFKIEEGRVIKTHDNYYLGRFAKKCKIPKILILTVREPLEINSSWKTIKPKSRGWSDPRWVLSNDVLESRQSKIILRYEYFQNNQFEYIFEQFEQCLGITIPDETKNKIKEYFSTEVMIKIASQQEDYYQYDPYTSVHGNHITNTNWKQKFSYQEAKAIYEKTYEIRKSWGYPDLDLEEIYDR